MLRCRHAHNYWKISNGVIQVEGKELPEGAIVTILAHEEDERFELNPEQESELLSAINEAERGELVSSFDLLKKIRT